MLLLICSVSESFCQSLAYTVASKQLATQLCDVRIKQEEPDTSMFCTCKQCGERSDGRDCLVCDSCEGMFHVSCIKPAVTEIPHKNWYCANCTASGIESPQEDCVMFERLVANSGNVIDILPSSEDVIVDDKESLYRINEIGVQVDKGSKRSRICKICGCMLNKGDEFRECEHPFCSYKVYHTRCLTNKELNSYGPKWYCPSCLCRVCLTNRDDDDLCLCDGCDHGYHTYCMHPPRTSIPKGKWFCLKCDRGIKAIRKVKKIYRSLERKQIKVEGNRVTGSSSDAKVKVKNAISRTSGMDMLLTAAKIVKKE